MTDIADIQYVEKTVSIVHPATKEPIGVKLNLMSPDDPRMERVKTKIMDERLALEAKGKNFKAEQLKKNRDMVLFRAITSWTWEGDTTFEGEKPELSQVNVLKVFNTLPWFRSQVDEEFSELESFFEAPKSK